MPTITPTTTNTAPMVQTMMVAQSARVQISRSVRLVASDAVDHAYIYRQYHQAQIESRGSAEVGSDRLAEVGSDRPRSFSTTLGSARSFLSARTYQHFR